MATQTKAPTPPMPLASGKTQDRRGSALALIYGVVCYAIFLGATAYGVGFVENLGVPKAIDTGRSSFAVSGVAVDVVLLGLFAAQHSVMARSSFKRVWRAILPVSVERSTFVLFASLALLLLFWQWRPWTDVLWQVDNPVGRWALVGLSFFGWLIVLVSTFLISHVDLFGLRQVYLAWRRATYTELPFRIVGLYRVVRHPLMLGFLLAFWATPRMTAGHLLFALANTGYIMIAVRFLEERDLVAAFGDTYIEYRRRVPMVLPLPRWRKR